MLTTYCIEIAEPGGYRSVVRIDGDDRRGGEVRAFLAAEMRFWRRHMERAPYHGRPRVRLRAAPAGSDLI